MSETTLETPNEDIPNEEIQGESQREPGSEVTDREPTEQGQEREQGSSQEQVSSEREPLSPDELEKRYENLKGALAEERGLRRKEQERLRRIEESIEEGRKAKEEPEIDIPDPNEDPIKYLEYDRNERIREAKERADRERQQRQQQRLTQTISEFEAEFAREKPDYNDALKHLLEDRSREIERFTRNPAVARQMALNDALALSQQAIDSGFNPAEALYESALSRGYKHSAPSTTDAQSQLEAVRKGQEAAKTLPKGGKARRALSLKEINQLPGDKFDEAIKALKAGKDYFG